MLTFDAEYARDQAIHSILAMAEEVSDLVAENGQLKSEVERLNGRDSVAEERHGSHGCAYCTYDDNGFTRNLMAKTMKENDEDATWAVYIAPKNKLLMLTHSDFVAKSITIERCPVCGRKL